MRAYSVCGPNATGSALKTAVTVIASATVRPRIYDLVVGNQNTPVDQSGLYAVTRFTAAGTAGSSPTPTVLDPNDVAAIATNGISHSAEPTYAATDLLQIPLHQRSTMRYVTAQGFEFLAPATAANGLGVRLVASTAAFVSNVSAFWFE